MKKIIMVLILMVFAVTSHAAWTVSVSLDRTLAWSNGQTMHVFKFDCASDAGSSGDQVLTTKLKENTLYGASVLIRTNAIDDMMKNISGGLLYYVKYQPSTTAVPASTSTITIDDETTGLIFSEVVTTANTAQGWSGDIDTNKLVPLTDFTVAMTTLGNADEAILWVWIIR